jgi:hypothetical protein
MVSCLLPRVIGLRWSSVARGLWAFTVLWATGGCALSSTEGPTRDAASTGLSVGPGVGGSPGGIDGGAGGEPDEAGPCGQTFNVCVDSCGRDITGSDWAPIAEVCQDGALTCPGSTFDYGSCPVGSCARRRPYCCDLATGDVTLAPCQADGLRVCGPETPETRSYFGCVPTALAGSGCVLSLAGQACTGPTHNCADGLLHCTCDQPDGDGGTAWSCHFESGIP